MLEFPTNEFARERTAELKLELEIESESVIPHVIFVWTTQRGSQSLTVHVAKTELVPACH